MPKQGLINGHATDEDDDEFHDREIEFVEDWKRENQPIIQPEPGEFSIQARRPYLDPDADKKVDIRRDFGSRGLQVIVKLANIHLTPEYPSYDGGSWHVEGQLVSHKIGTPC